MYSRGDHACTIGVWSSINQSALTTSILKFPSVGHVRSRKRVRRMSIYWAATAVNCVLPCIRSWNCVHPFSPLWFDYFIEKIINLKRRSLLYNCVAWNKYVLSRMTCAHYSLFPISVVHYRLSKVIRYQNKLSRFFHFLRVRILCNKIQRQKVLLFNPFSHADVLSI